MHRSKVSSYIYGVPSKTAFGLPHRGGAPSIHGAACVDGKGVTDQPSPGVHTQPALPSNVMTRPRAKLIALVLVLAAVAVAVPMGPQVWQWVMARPATNVELATLGAFRTGYWLASLVRCREQFGLDSGHASQ